MTEPISSRAACAVYRQIASYILCKLPFTLITGGARRSNKAICAPRMTGVAASLTCGDWSLRWELPNFGTAIHLDGWMDGFIYPDLSLLEI